jgi:maleamate amidohydrolase
MIQEPGMRIWDSLLSEQDHAVIEQAGYSNRGALNWESREVGKRPVCLIIDMQNLSVGRNVPILEAIKEYPTAMGETAWHSIGQMMPFLAEVRRAQVPIVYTRVMPRHYSHDDRAVQIIEPLAPQPGDEVIDKPYASAFFSTRLQEHLMRYRADTLVIIGNSTSGCVRATAVDARQYGYAAIIAEECVFDRIEASHKIALLDLWMKYAQVLPVAEVVAYLKNLTNSESN